MRKALCLSIIALMILAGPVSALIELDEENVVERKKAIDWYRPRPAITLDPWLEERFQLSEPGQSFDVLVRFHDGMKATDYDLVRNLGLRSIRTFEFIDGMHVRGDETGIRRLADNERVQIIEGDRPLDLLMDETTTTINASKTWNTRIVDRLGKEFPGIDGTGVTAVILDSGIDAGHPDLDFGEKVIMNLKSDSDGGWIEMLNTDTSSGHGTHCSGTVAGNGDASAGARRGVAPGANLIGLSTGEAVAILNAVGALEWVYEHSRPNNNPYNIRVVSNSWGSSGDYNPDNAITVASQKITYENNVGVIFAAGNAGADDHDGHTVTTNPYSLTPSSVSIAAIERDGSGVASFSSRGSAENNFTWPDVGAPGVKIWATEARKTLISTMRKQDPTDTADAYYMAISGTSMATPHISGVVALLFQAAPSLTTSELHDDSMENDTAYWEDPLTRVHEIEWIMEASSVYVNASGDNGVPENHSLGHEDHEYDFAQGYGLVQVDKAIALALTLEELRLGDPDATVADALKVYENIMIRNYTTRRTNQLTDNWFGDWSRLNDGNSALFTTTTHDVNIPNGTTEMNIVLNYNPAKSDGWQIGEATVTIDKDGNGQADWSGGAGYSAHGYKEWTIPVDGSGVWSFNVDAQAVQIPDWWRWRNLGDNEFNEASIEYSIGITLKLDVPEEGNVTVDPWDFHARNGVLDWAEPTADFGGNCTEPEGTCTDMGITLETYWYDLSKAIMPPPLPNPKQKQAEVPWGIIAAVVVIVLLGLVYYMHRKGMLPVGKRNKVKAKKK